MIDYLIIGSGLAGISFAELALQNNKSILVYDNASQTSTSVAAGIYNPVILKRFTSVWQAKEQLEYMSSFYQKIESKLEIKLDYTLPVIRKFFTIEEQNNWFLATDKPNLSAFLSTQIYAKKVSGIDAPFDYGQVLQTGFVDTKTLVIKYQKFLADNKLLISEKFDFSNLKIESDFVIYKNNKVKNIIFCEGFGMINNPFFNHLPLDGTKGELLIVKAPDLKLECILNASVYVVPLGNDLFKIGATYNWDDKTNDLTLAGKKELTDKLNEIINCKFEVIEHLAGVRPTVKDRMPMLGSHPVFKNIHILNGLGTRGVMLAPAMAKALLEHIEFNKPLVKEVDIKRFEQKKQSIF